MTATATKLRLIAITDAAVDHDWLTEAACRLRTAEPQHIEAIIDEAAHVARIAASTPGAPAVRAAYTTLSADLLAIDLDLDYRTARAAALGILHTARRAVNASA